nr:TPA_asm: hypothetical protein HUJ06_005529 [Nelumbo nucifera]
MTSFLSLSLPVETTMENSILPRLRFVSSSPRGRYSLNSGLNNSKFGFPNAVEGEAFPGLACNWKKMLNVYGRAKPRRSNCTRAVGKDSVEGKDSDDSVDTLQATIEKSKKVLAMQKDLLQQIAERRKLVSSIKNIKLNIEEDLDSYNGTDNSFPVQDLASTVAGSTNGKYANDIHSKSYTQATAVGMSETPDVDINGSFSEEEQGNGRNLSPEKVSLDIDSSKEFKETSSTTVQSDTVPSFLLKTSKYDLKDESTEELVESSLEDDVSSEANLVSEDETVKTPPLAGANVMNIILVAAECAPWSKTGGLGDVAGALPKALARRGHRVMVVAPRYGNYAEAQDIGVRKRYKVDGQDVEVNFFQAYIDGVDFVFMDIPMFRNIENNIYGGSREDILKRMVLFCKAAVEV